MTAVSEIAVDARDNGLVWITINRPLKHNALARRLLDALAAAVRAAGDDMQTRCIVVAGAGDNYFAAGGDLVDLASVCSADEINAMGDQATAALDAVRECPVPVIAYVNGDAIGGGAELAVACDMRIVAKHARIGFIHGQIGITSAWGGGPDLCALIGPSRAMQMMARCSMIDADLALAWGLADLVACDGRDGDDVRAFLAPLFERSALVVRGIKAQTSAWRRGAPRDARREVERGHLLSTWASAEHWAAVDRFLAKEKK